MGRLAYWQVLRGSDLAAKAVAQTTVRIQEPTRRGEIYDRSGTVVLATTVERDRLVAATDKLTGEQRRATGDELVRILALDPERAATLRDRARDRQGLHHPGARDRARDGGCDPGSHRGPHAHRDHARAGTDARLSADGRQPGLHAGGPSHGLRESGRQRPVRGRAGLPGRPRRHPADRGRRSRRQRPDPARPGSGRGSGRAGAGRPPDHRCRPAAGGRAGAPRRVGRRQGQERVGGRDGSVHRRGLCGGDRPLVRREPVPPDRRHGARAVHRPGRVERLRARVGLQDDDRDRRPRDRQRHPLDPDQGRRHVAARQGQDQGRRRRPQGHGLDVVPGRHRVLPQRRGGQGRHESWQLDPEVVGDPVRLVAQAGLRGADRHRRGRRGVRASSATRDSSRGPRSISPTGRSGRAWRSPRSSSRPPTRP